MFHCYAAVNAQSGSTYLATTISIASKAVRNGTGTLRNLYAGGVDTLQQEITQNRMVLFQDTTRVGRSILHINTVPLLVR